jgi:uncharacterized protein (TIGR01777 family)
MRIVVAGSSGYLGGHLVNRLREAGHQVVRLVRREPDRPDQVYWRPNQENLDPAVVDGAQAAINLAGAGVGEHRWTDEFKQLLRSSRVNPTGALAQAIARAADPPRVLLNASGIDFYGDAGETELTEGAPAGTGFFPELCQAWEAATQPAEQAGVRVVHLRTSAVLGPGSAVLTPLLRLYKLGLGGRMGSGRQWFPWISLADFVGAAEFLLGAEEVAGAANMASPGTVRNAEFARTLGKVLHRPVVLPVPAAALRLVAGELADQLLTSKRAVPAALATAGYPFRHPDLADALTWAIRRDNG